MISSTHREDDLISLMKQKLDCVSSKKCKEKFLSFLKEHEKFKKFLQAFNKLILDLTPSEAKNDVKRKGDDIKFIWNWVKNLCVDFMKLKKQATDKGKMTCECFNLIQKLRVLLRVKDKEKF